MRNSPLRPIYSLIDWLTGRNRAKVEFPPEVGSHGKWCMQRAREIIRPHHRLPSALNGRVVLVQPQIAIGGRPAYRWGGHWVGDLTSRSEDGKMRMELCWSPDYSLAVLIETMLHGFGHGWLHSIGIWGHPAQFDNDFHAWKQSRQATGVSYPAQSREDDFTQIVEVDSAGKRWITHIDLIPDPPQTV